ncbi:MAG: pyrimidine operon attenuation protein/uracil phosphoribosyltransferase [Cognaticolwellia sp.]|jgi:pyrimidine operon attenuation protein/uracil phosphoribosyltransferase
MKRNILEPPRLSLTLDRICHELIENHGDFSNSCLIGLQPRGVFFADRIHQRLVELGFTDLKYGKLDVTFHRDDFRRRDTILVPHPIEMDFIVEQKNVIFVDDVLYSGRTVNAALNAIQHYGRPEKVELAVLINRRFKRELPIDPDYVGLEVDTLDDAYVKVEWEAVHGEDIVYLIPEKDK